MDEDKKLTLLDKEIGISLFCSLSVKHNQIQKFNGITKEEEDVYLNYEANKLFLEMCKGAYKIINEMLDVYMMKGHPDSNREVEKIIEG
jgi:hypothetical protein